MSFTHLHVHSEYSLLDGLIKINQLLDRTISEGMKSVALTDHGAMYGIFDFYIKAKEKGIKPIIGVEVYKAKKSRFDKQPGIDRDQYHLLLLAKNYQGYKNLMKIVTIAHLEGYYYKPRVDFETLSHYSEGIIALSGCLNGEIPTLIAEGQMSSAESILKKYLSLYKDDFYIELQRHGKSKPSDSEGKSSESEDKVNKGLIALARKYAVPLVATADVHYEKADDAYAQEILLCIQTGRNIMEQNRSLSMIHTPDFYFKSEAEMKGLFIDLPEAIENTEKIASLCTVDIPYGTWILPEFPIETKETPEQYLHTLVHGSIKNRFAHPSKEIVQRVEYELTIISQKGYATYFLIVSDFVNWAKSKHIAVGPGRGSVAGSLVAYILRITDIDPIEYNLPFERFLNPDRPTPPDIDIDFADTRRDEVLAYVTQKYGKEKVAQIITFGRMEARLAVRDVSRALGMSYAFGDRIAKMIPQGKQGFAMTIEKALEENPALKYIYDNEEEVRKAVDIACKVEGLARHSSVHAAGVVIADSELTNYVPLQKEVKGDRIITQYDMYCIDLNAVSDNKAVGLLKVDFLGLRNLTILENAINYVAQSTGNTIDIHAIANDDKKTFELIGKGHTVGVFQLESQGMRRLAKELKPNKITDISAMVALYRPGPMDIIPLFLEGKKNPGKIQYLHKDLKAILGETYGVLVYQEQVMEIANKIAGYSMIEADILRMAMGKKKKTLMKKEYKKFIAGCLANKYTKKLAEQIFGFIEKFAGYGFNKPHSASYALIAYWTAYMKANYPVEYMTALLSAELQGVAGSQREIKMIQAIEECRSMDIKVLPPDINKSDYDFKIEKQAIRFGLSAIKHVGQAAIDSLLQARAKGDFIGLKDFLYRVDVRKANKKTIESLIKAGAFDHFGNRAGLLVYYPIVLAEALRMKNEKSQGQFQLFSSLSSEKNTADVIPLVDEFSESELLSMEKEVVGFSITKNPLAQYKNIIEKKITKKIGEITAEDAERTHIIAGTLSRMKKIVTKKESKEMAFVTLFDETGSIEAIVFPRTFAATKTIWTQNTFILAKGRVDTKDDRLHFLVENAVDLSQVVA